MRPIVFGVWLDSIPTCISQKHCQKITPSSLQTLSDPRCNTVFLSFSFTEGLSVSASVKPTWDSLHSPTEVLRCERFDSEHRPNSFAFGSPLPRLGATPAPAIQSHGNATRRARGCRRVRNQAAKDFMALGEAQLDRCAAPGPRTFEVGERSGTPKRLTFLGSLPTASSPVFLF